MQGLVLVTVFILRMSCESFDMQGVEPGFLDGECLQGGAIADAI